MQIRCFHASGRQDNLVVGGLVIAGTALGLKYALQVRPPSSAGPSQSCLRSHATPPATDCQGYNKWKEAKAATKGEDGAASGASGASSFFSKRYYEGGFEDKMTRREAALILGVR
jgi:DnaJ family protein C protein 15/DnaJ family protein C protein 19